MTSEKSVLEALSQIIDPDFNKDIVSLGFIKNLQIKKENISFDIQMTTPACPVKDRFKNQAEEFVGKLDEVKSVKVNMTSQKVQRGAQGTLNLDDIASIIAISSCKGGVGKSTIAAALAKEISQRGFKVGLFDADFFGPSVPTLFELHNAKVATAGSNNFYPIVVDGLKVVSFGFFLGEKPAVMRGPMVTNYLQQILKQIKWGVLDYLFIDMPPGTGDIQLTLSQVIQFDGAVIVTTPQALSISDVGKGIMMFDSVNVPILGVIENMAYFMCNSCNKKHYVFGEKGVEKLTERFGIEVLAQFPLSGTDYGITFNKKIENELTAKATDEVIRSLGKSRLNKIQKPEIEFNEKNITLTWSNQIKKTIENKKLRTNCHCAVCINEMTGQKTLQDKDIPDDIKATVIKPIGNYALSITWTDGHSSGLFSYKMINELTSEQDKTHA